MRNALRQKGHEAKLISDGDGYKGFPADLVFKRRPFRNDRIERVLIIVSELLGISGIMSFVKKWPSIKSEIINYDIVQLINPIALTNFGSIVHLYLWYYLKKHNKKIFLCALGDDYYWVNNMLKSETKYNVLSHLGVFNFHKEVFSMKYVYGFLYKTLNRYALKTSECVIPGLYDYLRVYKNDKCSNLVPLPVAPSKLGKPIQLNPENKIVIFHGWQKGKELKKGNLIFDRVAKKICEDYPDQTEYKVVQNVPYYQYIELLNSAHIALDQCYSYDKGMNGVLFMAAGKVTFTGMEESALREYQYYDPNKIYGINALNDDKYLYDKIASLIENPRSIEEISKNAIEFVKNNHSSDYVAGLYLNIWNGNYVTT